MAISLRTRLFLIVAVVLAAAVAASSVLTRQATLVEVREVVTRSALANEVSDGVTAAVQEQTGEARDLAAVGPILEASEKATGRPVLVLDTGRRIRAASNARLAAAELERATSGGHLALRIRDGGREAVIEVRGAPTAVLRDRSGVVVGSLHVLPSPDQENISLQERTRVPAWVLATLSTAVVGLALTFVVARRVLGPISELTGAVRRMEQGNLDVRVATPPTGDEVGELGRAFNAMASRLSTNERLRRQMVSDVAHELRSPVTNLRCTLEAMQDGLTATDRAAVDVLLEETLFLQRLIADLQDLALAEAGHLSLQSAPVDVGDTLRRAAASLGAGPGAAIAVTIDPLPGTVMGDAVRLEQVFRNLLSNARQHTPANGRIELLARGGTSGDVRITVTDSGDGIEAAHLPLVFERFYRADASRSRATGGAGLGLAIARQVVLAHGGQLTAESDGPGRGSRFIVTLPLSRG
jgi:two-component system sensor histidine kinase BaeS